MSRVVGRVFAIERHASLVEQARQRFANLEYDNIELRAADGTKGWPDAAPFDAIIVSAGGPEVPESLKGQLAIGGRLVIPVGRDERRQSLRKLVKTGASAFEAEDLGAVAFVPLIGEQGWAEDGSRAATTHVPGKSRGRSIPEMIADAAEPLPSSDDPAFGAMFDRFADRRVVLLGEASHGTSEFYQARAAITRRLIEAHGFDIVAVEADWPDVRPRSTGMFVCVKPVPVLKRRSGAFPPGCGATPTWPSSSNGSVPTTRASLPMTAPASTVLISTI
jgi:hypothetical protein